MPVVVLTCVFIAQITNSIIIDIHVTSVNAMNTFPQVTVDDKSMIRRWPHDTITAITISSFLVVVVVFGGELLSSDTVVLKFGEYTIVMNHSVVHVCMICKYQYVL